MFETFNNDDSLFHKYSADSTDLYSIDPVIGEDALTTESLTSYICRESEAHHVLPATVIRGVAARLGAPLDMTSLKNASAAINGVGILSARWVKIMEEMTGRPDIAKTTLQHLSGTISSRHLLKPRRAWCGLCLADFAKASGSIVYEPLIWLVKDYTTCIVHETSLVLICPECGRGSFPLEGHSRNGHCAKCGLWLGTLDSAQPAKKEDLTFSSAVNSVLTLLAGSENHSFEILQMLNFAFHASNAKSYEELSIRCGVSAETLRGWYYETIRPSLRDVAKLVAVFKINIGDIGSIKPSTPQPGKGRKPTRSAHRDLTIQYFITFVTENPDILFLEEICKIFKVGKSFFYTTYRDEATELLRILSERQKMNQEASSRKIPDIIAASKTNTPPPSLRDVAIQCGCHISNLYRNYNEECKEITRRYNEYKRNRSLDCQILRCKALEEAITTMAKEGIYPSMRTLIAAAPGGIKDWQIKEHRSEFFLKNRIPVKRFR